MPNQYEIVIHHARLRGNREELVDIGIAAGHIAAIEVQLSAGSAADLDAQGGLVSESFVNPHLHLCKVYTREMLDDELLTGYHAAGMGKAMNTIELAANVKQHYSASWIIKNVRRAVALAAMHGNTHIRAFADVDNKARLEGMRALIRAREEFKGIVAIHVCAFAQDGLVREPGANELMHQAMEAGADVVGGIPWIEYTEADLQQHVRAIFDLAQKIQQGCIHAGG